MTVGWKLSALPRRQRIHVLTKGLLEKAGFPLDLMQDFVTFEIITSAKGFDPETVIAEITKPDRSDNFLARAIVDQTLGFAYADSGRLLIHAPNNEKARKTLANLRGIEMIRTLKIDLH